LPPVHTEASKEKLPLLPARVFESMPDFFKRIVAPANGEEQKGALLLGALTVLSGAFPWLTGRLRDDILYANLFCLISGPPASGKGIVAHLRELLMPVHNELKEESKQLREAYEEQLLLAKKKKAKMPSKPLQKMLFIPGDSSSAGFLEIFKDSGGRGIMLETEGNVVNQAFKSEHGNYSNAFCQAFHHEKIDYYRKTRGEHIEIEAPCLSVLLSCTPEQIALLIPSAKSGVHSRFIFLRLDTDLGWISSKACKTEEGIKKYFAELGEEFCQWLKEFMKTNPEICFEWTDEQADEVDRFFSKNQKLYAHVKEGDMVATVHRLCIICLRLSMIFSALRMTEESAEWDDPETKTRLRCRQDDFENVMAIMPVLLRHSNHIYSELPQGSSKPKPKNQKELFFEQLPADKVFNSEVFTVVAQSMGIPLSTAKRWVKDFSIGHNQYQKPGDNEQ